MIGAKAQPRGALRLLAVLSSTLVALAVTRAAEEVSNPVAPATTRATTAPQTRPQFVVPDLGALLSRPQNPVRGIVQRYESDRASLLRANLIPYSPTRLARFRLFYRDWLNALEKLNEAKLPQDSREDFDKLRESVATEMKKLDDEAAAQSQLLPLVPFAPLIVELEEGRSRIDSMDPQKAAGILAEVKRQIGQTRTLLQADAAGQGKPVDKALAARAAEAAGALRNALKAWFAFYNDYDPLFTWWVGQIHKEVDQALADYAVFVREKTLVVPAGDVPPAAADLVIKLAGKQPQVADLRRLLESSQSEMRGVLQAYQGGRGGRRGGGGRADGSSRDELLRALEANQPGTRPSATRPGLASPNSTRSPQGPPRQYYIDWLAALRKLGFETLSRDAQVDYILLRNRIESDLRRLDLANNPPTPARLRDDSGITGRPIGVEALLVELAAEMIPYTPDELIAVAEKEFAWCEAEMKRASREMGLGDDWKQAVERVKTMYVPPGKQPELIRDLAWEAIEYLENHDLVTVPQIARESWRMQMMSPQRQLINPFFTGGEIISVSYPTAGMPYDAKLQSMRGNNIPFARATVFHELIPGHHLQGFMNARYQTHRRMFGTSFWGEGWALYWEMLLYQRGFAKTPEQRMGMLFWRSHRCARIVFSLGFHVGKMSPRQCIDYLVDRVGHERDNATAEVRRSFAGGYGPLYQAAYMLGGLQIRELHKELVESGKMTDKAFHDAVLEQGSMPVAMVRAILTNQKLTADLKPGWKFYGDNP